MTQSMKRLYARQSSQSRKLFSGSLKCALSEDLFFLLMSSFYIHKFLSLENDKKMKTFLEE